MSGEHHVYDWLRSRGYWMAPGYSEAETRRATHLLLDGGKVCVPDESHAAFLNAYAASVTRHPDRRPCMVELRTPVFRFFVDLDTRFADQPVSLEHPLRAMARVVAEALSPSEPPQQPQPQPAPAPAPAPALVCHANVPKQERDGIKRGFHAVWPDVYVTPATAMELRRRMLEELDAHHPAEACGLANAWDDVVDSTVYLSNGLRMPWSAKGRDDKRFYEIKWTLTPDALTPVGPVAGVAALRDHLHRLSIRAPGRGPSLTLVDDQPAAARGGGGGSNPDFSHKSLAGFADVLPTLAAALPAEFQGQKFTSLLATDHCFMLRSTARHCFNVGREHRSSNVYFLLTRKGVSQRCYCRKDTQDGRKWGACKDFSSQVWDVPQDVIVAFFGVEDDPPTVPSAAPTSTGVMPSRMAKSYLNFESLMARSRPQHHLSPKSKKARVKKN